MSEREEDRPEWTADEARALAVLKRFPTPAVPDEVRERALRAFLAGGGSEIPLRVRVSPAFPLADRHRGRSRAARIAVGLAAAAAIVLLVRAGLQPVGSWRVTDAVVPEGIELPSDGRIPADTLAPLASLRPGRIRVGALSELELQLDSKLRLRMLSGTEAALPAAPTRWFGRDRALEVRAGEIFGATFEPLGFQLRLSTPEGEAVLSGTSFAVIRNEEVTCFCLYRGRLGITARRNREPIELPLEHRVLLYRDGRPPRVEPITDRERMKLSMMEAARPGAAPSH